MNTVFFVLLLLSLLGGVFVYWLLNGDYERYIGVIQLPYPFNQLGSTPVQLYFVYFPLILLTIIFFIISLYIAKKK